ncbi:hypothetical protein O6H91_10G028500 [Diphasiastrum complanatum]|uniref:Uncharacterized protein n=1 Tax=Diphasiastrum complanatum TaxID=34168 RepID=A0ACC2CFG8_DIPCM|nr:hypothetical protein O6H91_10G028500 [Diphasiastrum complanatum]
MGRHSDSSSACKDHHWKEGHGVCPSCLTERLLTVTCASKARQLSTAQYTDSAENPAKADSNIASKNLSGDVSVFSTADASFSWQRSKSLGKGGPQRGRNSKESLCDTEDDQRMCFGHFDSDRAKSDLSYRQDKSFKVTDSCGKGGVALAGLKAYYSWSSSVRMDRCSKPEKKHKICWTPYIIFRRLFGNTKTTNRKKSYDQPDPAAGMVRASSVLEGNSSSDCKSSNLKKVSSLGCNGSEVTDPTLRRYTR